MESLRSLRLVRSQRQGSTRCASRLSHRRHALTLLHPRTHRARSRPRRRPTHCSAAHHLPSPACPRARGLQGGPKPGHVPGHAGLSLRHCSRATRACGRPAGEEFAGLLMGCDHWPIRVSTVTSSGHLSYFLSTFSFTCCLPVWSCLQPPLVPRTAAPSSLAGCRPDLGITGELLGRASDRHA
jgi:hypothetical protein